MQRKANETPIESMMFLGQHLLAAKVNILLMRGWKTTFDAPQWPTCTGNMHATRWVHGVGL